MTTTDPVEALLGELVDDRYRLRRMIGRGGMGAVYEADAVRLGRLCAVKVLLPEYTRDETAMQRFRREALVASRVKHTHVVDIFDTGTTSAGLGYIAMELLHGESLGATLRREKRLPWPRARHIALQICRALAAAHARGVIHRDMKPDNCFRMSQDGDPDFIKILDFGIAKLMDTDGADLRLTASDSLIGTYSYMAYEQIKGLDPDHRVDIWAVGIILYVMLTGKLPFFGQNERQVFSAILLQEPTPIRDLLPGVDVPPELEAVVARALEKSRDARFPTVDALARALEDVGRPKSPAASVLHSVAATDFTPLDDDAQTLDRGLPARSPTRVAASAEPPGRPNSADIPEDTADSGRRALVPSTDPLVRGEVARAAESMGTAPARLPDLGAAEAEAAAPARIAPLVASSVFLTLALLAVVSALVSGSFLAEPPPTSASEQAPEPAQPPAASVPATALEQPKTVDAPVPPPATPTLPSAEADTRQSKTRSKRPAKRPAVDYKTAVFGELTKLCISKPIRDCFVDKQKQGEEMKVSFQIDPATGAVQPIFPLLQRNSGLAVCLESKMKTWRLPKAGPGEPPSTLSCTLNRQR
ncbi:serine/threonine protein kinase [Nannocystis pusilla]|uniref:serine/threonine protein kinase n=1 Tax=Nannocystis pusilla TaxID=889268 RepID=UPI003DA67197